MSFSKYRFAVGDISGEFEPHSVKEVDAHHFCNDDQSKGLIKSSLLLVQSKDGRFKGKFKIFKMSYGPHQYEIILSQSDQLTHRAFMVCISSSPSHLTEAFQLIISTLEPLLREGTVMMTKSFLKRLILPKPVDPLDLPETIVHLMEKKPSIHSEWHIISQLTEKIKKREITEEPKILKKKETVNAGLFGAIMQTTIPLMSIDAADNDESEDLWKTFFKKCMSPVNYLSSDESTDATTSTSDKDKTSSIMFNAVKKGFVKSAFYSIISGSDPNYKDSNGDTALHVAVKTKNVLFVKLLLAFNADLTILNFDGKTPLDLAKVEFKENEDYIIDKMREMKRCQEHTCKYFASNTQLPEPIGGAYILTLDGGGARAFNLLRAVIAIENRMKQLDPSCKPFKSYFDYVGGTSSGAIGGLFLGYTDYDSHVMQALIYRCITDVFSAALAERGEKMEIYLKNLFGEETRMADIKVPLKVIVTGTLADRDPNKLHLMTSYGKARDNQLSPNERKVWEAARITSAAPIYFPSFQDKFLDGGLMANNPTLDTMTEVINEGDQIGCVVSLGTGKADPTPVENVEVFIPHLFGIPKAIKGFSSFFDHLITQVTQSDGQEVVRAQMFCKALQADYYRVSPTLLQVINPLMTNIDDIIDMLFNTQLYLLKEPEKIDAIAKRLLTKLP